MLCCYQAFPGLWGTQETEHVPALAGAEHAGWVRWAGLGETRSGLCRGRELDGEPGAQGEGCAARVEGVEIKVEPGQEAVQGW